MTPPRRGRTPNRVPARTGRRRPIAVGLHAGYYVSPVHDHHNVSDGGLDTWREGSTLARELPAHEIGQSVKRANSGAHGSDA